MMDIGKDLQRAYNDGYEHGKMDATKYGEWVEISSAHIYEHIDCGYHVMTADIEEYQFCPRCGARMDMATVETDEFGDYTACPHYHGIHSCYWCILKHGSCCPKNKPKETAYHPPINWCGEEPIGEEYEAYQDEMGGVAEAIAIEMGE